MARLRRTIGRLICIIMSQYLSIGWAQIVYFPLSAYLESSHKGWSTNSYSFLTNIIHIQFAFEVGSVIAGEQGLKYKEWMGELTISGN